MTSSGTASRIYVQIFGGLRVWRDGAEVDVGGPRNRLVLSEMVAAEGRTVSTSDLIDLVWGEEPSRSATNQLHRIIGDLRRLFEPSISARQVGQYIQSSGTGYRLILSTIECDLNTFTGRWVESRGDQQETDPTVALEFMHQACELAQEPPFVDLPPDVLNRPLFARVMRSRLAVANAYAALLKYRPESALLPLNLERIAVSAPLNEPLQAHVIDLLSASNRQTEAMRWFDTVSQQLRTQLDVEPGGVLTRAYDRARVTRSALPPAAPPVATSIPAQLPMRVAGYVRRLTIQTELERIVPAHGEANEWLSPIVVLTGLAGIGKTSTALDWCHQLRETFPDGQLYLNLRGFDPDRNVMHPVEGLTLLLDALNVRPVEGLETTTAGYAAALRSALAGKKILLLLDNARDAAQVRNFLPGSKGCLVVVTSRNQLTSLSAREGAKVVKLQRLTEREANQLITYRLGSASAAELDTAATRLIRFCAGLPLALAVAAARVATLTRSQTQQFIEELDSAPEDALDVLSTEDSSDDLRTIFSWSYDLLSDAAARTLRVLSIHPGPDASVDAVAGITGMSLQESRQTLKELMGASLLSETSLGRYVVHDLLKMFASSMYESSDERNLVVHRTVAYYLVTLQAAQRAYGKEPTAGGIISGTDVQPMVALANLEAASVWYDREKDVLVNVIDLAFRVHLNRWGILLILDRRLMSQWQDLPVDLTRHAEEALRRVTDLEEPYLEAELRRELGSLYHYSDPLRAVVEYEKALALYRSIDDVTGEAHALRRLSAGHEWRQFSDTQKVDWARQSVSAARRSSDRHALALALAAYGSVLDTVGDYATGIQAVSEALDISTADGNSSMDAYLGAALSQLYTANGQYVEAVAIAEWALQRPATDHDYIYALVMLAMLAKAAAATGNINRARSASVQFHIIFDDRGKDAVVALIGDELTVQYLEVIAAVDAALAVASSGE